MGDKFTIHASNRFINTLDHIAAENRTTLIESLASVIATDLKAHYILSNIMLPIQDSIARNAFISALLTFDYDTDKIIARTILNDYFKKQRSLDIDGLYDFMLQSLKRRWDEVILLANQNTPYLVCKHTFGDLLDFLISNIDQTPDETIFQHIREADIRESVKQLFNTCTKSN